VAFPERSQYARVSACRRVCRMTVLALLLAVLAVFVVGTMLLLGAHWFSVMVAKSLEKLIEVD
jgi:membrane-associated phospholipid phosphatase